MTSLDLRPPTRRPSRTTYERPVTRTDLLLTLFSFLATTALTVGLLLLLTFAGVAADTVLVLTVTTGVVLWLAGIAWALRRRGWSWADLGLGPGGPPRSALWQVPIAWIAVLVLTGVVGSWLLDAPESNAVETTQAALNLGPVALVGLAVAVVAIGPFVEEIIFRRVLLGWLEARVGVVVAVVGQAAVFAVMHVLPQAMLLTFFLGLATGLLARRHRSLWPALALHAVNNAVAVAVVASTLA